MLLLAGCGKSKGSSDDVTVPTAAGFNGSCNIVYNDVQSYCYEYRNFTQQYATTTLQPFCKSLSAGKPIEKMATTWSVAACKTEAKVIGCKLIHSEAETAGEVTVWYYDATTWATAIEGCPEDRRVQP